MHEWDEAERVRERLAHRLHDGPIQELTAAQLFLDGLALRLEADGADSGIRAALERGLDALRQATLACRTLMDTLRPGVEADGELEDRLRRLVHGSWPDAQVAVELPAGFGARHAHATLVAFRVTEELVDAIRRDGGGLAGITARADEAAGRLVVRLATELPLPAAGDPPDSWTRARVAVTAEGGWTVTVPLDAAGGP